VHPPSDAPPYHGVEWTKERELHPVSQFLIGVGHVRVERSLRINANQKLLSLEFLTDIHTGLFSLVFPDFAGKLRGPAPPYIPRNVSIGDLARGYHADLVPAACTDFIDQLRRLTLQLDDRRTVVDAAQLDDDALNVAAWAHSHIIEIHPFVDGNGRTARACINYFALRYGATWITFEANKSEYMSANRTWIKQRKVTHLVDYLRPFWLRPPTDDPLAP
jgi:fido (protein-threonine AMPylation protein)